jgi:WD40 repeat protein
MREFREIVLAAAAASCVAGVAAAQHADTEMASYRAHIAAAEYALRLNDVGHAREWLEGAPAAWRGFEWRALWAMLDGSVAEVVREGSAVWEVSVRGDGRAIATSLSDGAVAVYDVDASGGATERWRVVGHKGVAYRVDWSPDGTMVASAGADATVRVLDAATGAEKLVYKGHTTPVPGLDFSPDGVRIASASYRMEATPEGGRQVIGTVRVWSAATGEDEFAVDAGVKPISMVRWSPDGRRIAAGSWDGEVHVFDAAEGGRNHLTMKVPESEVYAAVNCVAWSPDGARVMCGSKDRTARVYDAVSGALLGTVEHEGWVTACAWSVDGALLATGSEDNLVKVWDAGTFGLRATLRGHTLGLGTLAFAPAGGDLYSAGADMVVKRWDVGGEVGGRSVSGVRFKDSAACYAALFTPDGERIWTCAYDGTIGAWDAKTGALVHDVAAHASDQSANTLSMTRDGSVVASCSYDGTVKLWDAKSGALVRALAAPGPVYHATMAPDGAFVACITRNVEGVTLVDVATNTVGRTLGAEGAGLHGTAISPDGSLVVASGGKGFVRVWDARSGEEVRDLPGLSGNVEAIAFTPDGRSILAGNMGGRIIRWSAATGETEWEGSVGNSSVTRLAVTPDGSRVAAVGEGAHILDAATGQHLATFRPHNDTIWHCAFNADGTRLATASWDGNVVVIETEPYRVRRGAMGAAGSKE